MRLGILIAKSIVSGDISLARKLRDTGPRWWTVAECRAVAGACREANRRYGCQLSLSRILAVERHFITRRHGRQKEIAMGEVCNGTMRNGPDKAYTVCSVCGRIDYEKNEGDQCWLPVLAPSACKPEPPFPNRYEEKVEAKRERYAERAPKALREASAAYAGARRIMDGIPMGQPILVGHHSEKRHRKDIERIDRGLRKSGELEDKAAYLADKAENYGTHGVSSDDPAAVTKLRAELAALESARALEKTANAAIRKAAKFREKEVGHKLTRSDHIAVIGMCVEGKSIPADFGLKLLSYARAFPWLPQFGNHTQASIKRVEARIAELTTKAAMPDRDARGEGYSVEWNKLDNRVQIYFVDKPSDAKIAALKSHGFRWARSIAAWQRHASEGAWYHAMRIVGHAEPARETNSDPTTEAGEASS